jgi:hypothetical protein
MPPSVKSCCVPKTPSRTSRQNPPVGGAEGRDSEATVLVSKDSFIAKLWSRQSRFDRRDQKSTRFPIPALQTCDFHSDFLFGHRVHATTNWAMVRAYDSIFDGPAGVSFAVTMESGKPQWQKR